MPIAYVVMKRKTTTAYTEAFKKLRELGLDADEVITDWEKAERDGWRLAFPDRVLKVYGCVWHFIRVST